MSTATLLFLLKCLGGLVLLCVIARLIINLIVNQNPEKLIANEGIRWAKMILDGVILLLLLVILLICFEPFRFQAWLSLLVLTVIVAIIVYIDLDKVRLYKR